MSHTVNEFSNTNLYESSNYKNYDLFFSCYFVPCSLQASHYRVSIVTMFSYRQLLKQLFELVCRKKKKRILLIWSISSGASINRLISSLLLR